ncbi:hypothetical protein IM40_03990 [Candidatus Paracaedimonas acanthamoebae]|nr:hypothetical protein IM40_03990 [Candidatus Paracaedimonas acanthamoebae]
MQNKFFKVIARLVLVSYSIQSLTPFALACDVDHSSSTYNKHFPRFKDSTLSSKDIIQGPLPIEDVSAIKASYIPSVDEMVKAQRILEKSQPTTLGSYQYKISIKTLNPENKAIQFKVSRKSKTSQKSFETLYTASVEQDRITPFFTPVAEAQADTFLSLCKGASLVNYKNDSMVWYIPGFATVNILKDGAIFFDQLATSPFQSAYDLVLKTSQELFIQTLNAKSLTLKSQKTHFSHAVVADHLHIFHEAINEGGLRVKRLTGEGQLTNHAYCQFQGTQAERAVLGLSQITNEKRMPTAEGAKIESTYLHIASTNQLFKNSEEAEVRVSEELSADLSSSPSGASMVNEGAFYVKEATLKRQASNNGFWQAHKMVVKGKPFINSSLSSLRILDQLAVNSELMNQGDIETKHLSLAKGHNTGTIKGEGLILNVQGEMTNEGEISLQQLIGNGLFKNYHTLDLLDLKEPATLSILQFINKTQSKGPRALVRGKRVSLGGQNKSFVNDRDADIFVDHLSFQGRPEDALSYTLHNLGTLKSSSIDVSQRLIENAGKMMFTTLAIVGGKLHNLTEGVIEALEAIKVTKSHILNKGSLLTGETNGQQKFSLLQEAGEFNNEGKWFHEGHLKLDSGPISNQGTIVWRNGTLEFKPTKFHNYGQWLFEHISCTSPLDIQNDQTLELQNSSLFFTNLINNKSLILRSGQYTIIGTLKNNSLISFQDNEWHFTEDDTSTTANRLVLKGDARKNYSSQGEIESQKDLTYDVQTLPKAIRSQEGILFTSRYRSSRTLADLSRVSTNKQGKVVFYTPAITTTKNYDFANIGHLILYVGGLFTTTHKFTAPTLTFDVNGPLTCGSSNTVMGEIASTEGSLTVTAHSIDNRFGKMYGKGPTLIKATKGNALVGAPQKGIDEDFKKYYYANTSFSTADLSPTTARRATHTREHLFDDASKCNEAYLASEDNIIIDSASNVIVDCGTVFSGKGSTFKATKNIQNTAGKIFSLGTTLIQGYEYKHTGKPPKFIPDSSSFDGEGWERPTSGPATLDSLGDIHINTHKVTNCGSTVRTQGKIYVNGIAINDKISLSNYIEEPANCIHKWTNGTQWFTRIIFSYPCIVQSAIAIHINTGNYVLSGNKHSGTITIQASGSGLFDNSKQMRSQITLSGPALVNLTSAIQAQAKGNSLLRLTPIGEVLTTVPLGSPYVPLVGDQMIMLSTRENHHLYQIPLDPSRLLSPLQTLSLGLYNLFTQATLSQVAGRVSINHSNKDTLFQSLIQNGISFGQDEKKAIVTLEDVQKARHSMILPGLSQVGDKIHQILSLFVAQEDMNSVQGMSADTMDVYNQGPLTVKDTTIKIKKWMHFFSEDHLSFLSTISTHFHGKGTQESLDSPTSLESEEGEVIALGKKGFQMTATKLRSLLRLIAGSLEGNSDIEAAQLKRTEHSYHTKKGGFFKGDTTTHTIQETTISHPSELVSEKEEVTILSGDTAKTTITGSLLKSIVAIIFQGKDLETHAAVGINTTKTESETDGLFSSSHSHSVRQSANFAPTTLSAPAIHTNTESAIYRGTDFIADIIYDNTKEGATFAPSISWLEYFHQIITKSPFLKSDVGCKGGYEVMQPCRLLVNQIIRQVDEGEIKLQSVDWNKDRTQIIGKFAETTYHLKSWQKSWAHHKQLIPNEALVVVALGVTLATQGWGASLINSLGESLCGVVPAATAAGAAVMVPAVTLSSTGMAVANAGFSTICSQLTCSVLRTGNPIQAGKELISPASMRSLAVTMTSAGLCQNISEALKIDLHPGLTALTDPQKQVKFMDFLQANALKTVVETPLQCLIGRISVEEAVKNGVKNLGVDTLASYASYHIGRIYADPSKPMGYFEHKALHGSVGALSGWFLDSSARGLMSGAIGSIVSEVVMEECRGIAKNKALDILAKAEKEGQSLKDGKFQLELYDALSKELAFAKLSGATVAALLGQDPSIGAHTSTNAVENNAIMLAVGIGLAAYEVYDVIKTAQREGPAAALQKVAVDGAITIVTLGAGKVVYKVAKLSGPMAEMVWQAYIAQNPAFAQVIAKVFAPLSKGFTKAKELYLTADGLLSETWSKGMQKLTRREAPGITKASVPGNDLDIYAPPRAQSRINIIEGTGKPNKRVEGETKPGIDKVWRKHMNLDKTNKSQFTIPKEEVRSILSDKKTIETPITKIVESGRYVREVDVGTIIGKLPSQHGSNTTSIITILTDAEGNLVNVFPGPLKYMVK